MRNARKTEAEADDPELNYDPSRQAELIRSLKSCVEHVNVG